jgi:hypothetical protein
MVSVVALGSLLCLAIAAAALLFRQRRVGVNGLDNVTVSRQWLAQHRADDHS